MESVTLTTHAAIRKQQRGIPGSVLDYLMEFGKISHDNRGAEVLYFDKQARRRCLMAIGRDRYRKLDGHLDVYAVRGTDGALLTMGHRRKRIHRS